MKGGREIIVPLEKVIPRMEVKEDWSKIIKGFRARQILPCEGDMDQFNLPKYSDEAIWEQVAIHSLGVMYVADTLAEVMGVDEEERLMLCQAALLHDTCKKTEQLWLRELQEKDLNDDVVMNEIQNVLKAIAEMEDAENALDLDIDPNISKLMHANFPPPDREQNLLEKIMFFSDAVVQGVYDDQGNTRHYLVTLKMRLEYAQRKNSIMYSNSFVDIYGKPLFEVQLELGSKYEQEFAGRLGISVEDFYLLLQERVSEKIRNKYVPY